MASTIELHLNFVDKLRVLQGRTVAIIGFFFTVLGSIFLFTGLADISSGLREETLMPIVFGSIFPIVGSILFLTEYQRLGLIIAVLKNGTHTVGYQKDITKSWYRINKRNVYEIKYDYEVNGKSYTNITKSTYPNTFLPEEPLIYSNSDHKQSLIIRDLPFSIVKKIKQFTK